MDCSLGKAAQAWLLTIPSPCTLVIQNFLCLLYSHPCTLKYSHNSYYQFISYAVYPFFSHQLVTLHSHQSILFIWPSYVIVFWFIISSIPLQTPMSSFIPSFLILLILLTPIIVLILSTCTTFILDVSFSFHSKLKFYTLKSESIYFHVTLSHNLGSASFCSVALELFQQLFYHKLLWFHTSLLFVFYQLTYEYIPST